MAYSSRGVNFGHLFRINELKKYIYDSHFYTVIIGILRSSKNGVKN